jgi:hypothetical protein
LLTLGTLFGFRVGSEKRMMAERFGDAYRDYAAHTFPMDYSGAQNLPREENANVYLCTGD